MKTKPSITCSARSARRKFSGKIGWALLWLLGVPLPVLLIIYMLKGCS